MKASIIIVHYKVKEKLFECLDSIYTSKNSSSFEVIVVDNDEEKTLKNEINKKFPKVKYVENTTNSGFGAGNNIGAKHAKGEYLFFLNPDTRIYNRTIDRFMDTFKTSKNVGIVAPILVDKLEKTYPLQGSLELTPMRALFVLSFVNKFFPNNVVSQKYFLKDWDKKHVKEVSVVPGTAFMIRKSLFEKVGRFDEKFFLYFEEFDLCKRVSKICYKMYINPKSKVLHYWEESTKNMKNRNEILSKTRFLYFKKHFGLLNSLFVESILSMNKEFFAVFWILILGLFLRVYLLSATMSFIGDQGWFYISARDMILSGNIPLVGITSSHVWLHQGALWTYILGVLFYLFHFDPLAPAYFTAFMGVVSVGVMFYISKKMFSKDVGYISSLLYASSPLVVLNDRLPYHTALISFFTILFLFLMYKLVKGSTWVFPFIIGTLAVLYNFEIATFTLVFVYLIILGLGFFRKELFIKRLKNKKIVIWSIFAFVIPMTPMLLYDISHGFPQTVKFVAWMGYKVLQLFGFFQKHVVEQNSVIIVIQFLFNTGRKIIFANNLFIAFSLFIFGLLISLKKIKKWNYRIIILACIIPIVGLIITKTPSDAYVPVLFPPITILVALFLNSILFINNGRVLLIVFLLIISGSNSYYLVLNQFTFHDRSRVIPFQERVNAVKSIIQQSDTIPYTIHGKGRGSEFNSFTMNYEYLAWWLGHAPSKKRENLSFTIEESNNGIVTHKYLRKL